MVVDDFNAQGANLYFMEDFALKKISLSKVLRIVAVLIFIVGACVGYDIGDKMIDLNGKIVYQFDFLLAVLYWFISFAIGMLFFGIAKIIDLLENR